MRPMTAMVVALLCAVMMLLWPSGDARAYHNADFATPVVRGGGNGMYFTGSPRYKRYDCTVCHIGSEGLIGIELASDPPELFAEQRYTPGQLYRITVTMTGEHVGDVAQESGYDHNSFVAEFNDDEGALLGDFNVDPADGVFTMDVAGGDARVVAGYWGDGGTAWTMEWTAPAAGSGRATLYLAAVDGNAAGGGVATVVDPFGDDVFAGGWRMCEAGSSCELSFAEVDVDDGVLSPHGHCSVTNAPGQSSPGQSSVAGWFAPLTLLAAMLLRRPRRRRKRYERRHLRRDDRRLSHRRLGYGLLIALITSMVVAGCEHPELPGECADDSCDYTSEGEPYGNSPLLDMPAFRCQVQPILQARCAFFPCHGDPTRPFVVYAPNRLRLDASDDETVVATTPAEQQANYEAAIKFSRDDEPAKSWLLLKPLDPAVGGYYHFGESLYYQSDVFLTYQDLGYDRMLSWISGAALPADCETSKEVGP